MQPLTPNAERVLEARYLARDDAGRIVENWEGLCRRVARGVATVEKEWGGDGERWEEAFFGAIQRREFLPNSPTLMNAGTEIGQLAACFVLPVEDTLASVFEAVKEMAVIHQSGGGTGFDFSALRPAGDVVQGTPGVASGPVAFMGVFDAATAVVKQGGRRRGANMGVLRVDHPDVLRVHPRQVRPHAAHQLQHLARDARPLLAGRRGGRALRAGESARRPRGAQRRRARAARRDRELRVGQRRSRRDSSSTR